MPVVALLFILGPILLLALAVIVFKTNAAILFLLLCSGIVLDTMIGDDAVLVTKSGMPSGQATAESITHIGLIVLPVLVGLLFLRNTVSKAKLPLHILPGLMTGAALVLVVGKVLPAGVRSTILGSSMYLQLSKYQGMVFIIGVLTSLLIVSMSLPRHHDSSKHKKH